MSTQTHYVSRMQQQIALEELRWLQREAEEARRVAALRDLSNIYFNMVERQDESRKNLPDLLYVLAPMPPFTDPVKARDWINARRYELDTAINRATEILAERRRRAEALKAYSELREAACMQDRLCQNLAGEARVDFVPTTWPAQPSESSSMAEISLARDRVSEILKALTTQRDKLHRAVEARSNVNALVGDHVAGTSAWATNQDWQARKNEERLAQTQAKIGDALNTARLKTTDLPEAMREMAQFVIDHGLDPLPVVDSIHIHRSRLEDRALAARLLANPPPYLEAAELLHHWRDLAHNLELVADGNSQWQPLFEGQWEQLHNDSNTAMAAAYFHASFIKKAHEEGFSQLEDDGPGLTLMDLGECYLEIRHEALEDGVIETTQELLAKPGTSEDREPEIIAAACAKVSKLNLNGNEIESEIIDQEHARRLRRASIPDRRVMAVPLSGRQ